MDAHARDREQLRTRLHDAAAQLEAFTALPVVHRVLARIHELETHLLDTTLPWSPEREVEIRALCMEALWLANMEARITSIFAAERREG
jgi:hypothetical protein